MPSLVGSGEEDEDVKSLEQSDGQTDRWTDDGRQANRKAHIRFKL